MIMVESSVTGALFQSIFPRVKTQRNGLNITSRRLKNKKLCALNFPDVSSLNLNDNQRALVILVLHTPYPFVRTSLIITLCNLLSLELQEQESCIHFALGEQLLNMEIATTCCFVFHSTQIIFSQLDILCGK